MSFLKYRVVSYFIFFQGIGNKSAKLTTPKGTLQVSVVSTEAFQFYLRNNLKTPREFLLSKTF